MLRSIGRVLFGRVLPRRPYPVLRGPLRGAQIVLGSLAGEGGGASVYFDLLEPEQSRALLGLLRPGAVFCDVGANVGYYTLLGSRLVGSAGAVLAVEPSVRNLALLRRHVELNRAANVRVVAGACAERDGYTRFEAGANSAVGHLAGATLAADAEASADRVPTHTLDGLVAAHGIVPDVVKIDVEGAELRVLQGAVGVLRRDRPALLLSVHSDALRDACLALLRELGYAAQPLAPSGTAADEYLARPLPQDAPSDR